MNAQVSALLVQADQASAAQDFTRAQALLRDASNAAPDDASILLKLAGVSRAMGQLRVALDAIHRALAIIPLDFTALLMKASLLERMGDGDAGEAWGYAIAQKPEGPLPSQISSVLAQGERTHATWQDARENRLKKAMMESEQRANEEEKARIERFRSNALRRTKPFHSTPTHFQYPALTEREFHPRRLFPWLDELEAETEAITAEFEGIMASERAELVPYIQYEDHIPMRQWQPLNHNLDWTAIHLVQNGQVIDANARHCPRTMALLKRLPQPQIQGASPNAMFSLLAPHTAIPPHVGISNARLVCHLPLMVPQGCWFRVGEEVRHWQRGEAFVFDDTIEHEAMNPTDQLRIVFICDVWHPDLSSVERDAVAALIAEDGRATHAGL